MEFHPLTIYAFLLLPLFFFLILFRSKQQRTFLKRLKLLSSKRKSLILLRSSLIFLVIFFLIAATANLKIKTKRKIPRKVPGKNIYFLLDVSKSMNEKRKLRKAEEFLLKLSQNLSGDKLGLIVYSDYPYTLIPITSDLQYFRNVLKQDALRQIQSRGSDIRYAFSELVRRFQALDSLSQAPKIAVILSDGEHFGEEYSSRLDFLNKMNVSLLFLKFSREKTPLDSLNYKYPDAEIIDCSPRCSLRKIERKLNKSALEQIQGTENYLPLSYFLLVPALILFYIFLFLRLKQ